MLRRRSALAAVAAATTLALTGTACFGSFTLTRKVYEFNKGLGDKFVQSLVMWGLIIFPVYGVAAAVDLWILNLIEFWTGSNPLAMGESRDVQIDGQTLRFTRINETTLEVARIEGGAALDVIQMSMIDNNGQIKATNLKGEVVATASLIGGGVAVQRGGQRFVYAPAEVESLESVAAMALQPADAAVLALTTASTHP